MVMPGIWVVSGSIHKDRRSCPIHEPKKEKEIVIDFINKVVQSWARAVPSSVIA